MNFDEEISNFHLFTDAQIQFWLKRRPTGQDGLTYFETHFFDLFNELQREGQRILDKWREHTTRQDRFALARNLQEITESALLTFKTLLIKN